MVRVMPVRDPTRASLTECVDALAMRGFDPLDEESLAHAGHWLSRLGNDRSFIGDLLVDLLGARRPSAADGWAHLSGHQVWLAESEQAAFQILATIWPVTDGPLAQWPQYGRAHDHAEDLIVLGYFGPGCLREHFLLQAGRAGNDRPARMRPQGQMTIGEGCMVHYRAGCDVQRVHPPTALSISLSLAHRPVAAGRRQRRYFNVETGLTEGPAGRYPGEALLRAAVALGGDRARGLALHVANHHDSDSLRLSAWEALSGQTTSAQARDALWRQAENSGSRHIAAIARGRRTQG